MASTVTENQVRRYAKEIQGSFYFSESRCDLFTDNTWELQCTQLQGSLKKYGLIAIGIGVVGVIMLVIGLSLYNDALADLQIAFLFIGLSVLCFGVSFLLYLIKSGQSMDDRKVIGIELLKEYKIAETPIDVQKFLLKK